MDDCVDAVWLDEWVKSLLFQWLNTTEHCHLSILVLIPLLPLQGHGFSMAVANDKVVVGSGAEYLVGNTHRRHYQKLFDNVKAQLALALVVWKRLNLLPLVEPF